MFIFRQKIGLNSKRSVWTKLSNSVHNKAVKRIKLMSKGVRDGIRGTIKKSSGKYRLYYSPIKKRGHWSSPPGHPPNRHTGKLEKSINVLPVRRLGKGSQVFFPITQEESKAKYGSFLEFGTSKMKARPFFYPYTKKYAESKEVKKFTHDLEYAVFNDLVSQTNGWIDYTTKRLS